MAIKWSINQLDYQISKDSKSNVVTSVHWNVNDSKEVTKDGKKVIYSGGSYGQSGLDTSTPTGKMMFQMVGIFSEFERSIITARVKAGMDRFKKNGGKLGRPSNLNEGMINSIKFMREKGVGIRKISKELGVGVSTIYKVMEA